MSSNPAIEALPNALQLLPKLNGMAWDLNKNEQLKLWNAVQELQTNQLLIIQALKSLP